MKDKKRVLVTGAGGFIGHHCVKFLKDKGYWVRGVDVKEPLYESTIADEFLTLDLRYIDNANEATKDIDDVYHFAANMGGMGFITTHNAEILHDNVIIDANVVDSAKNNGVKRLFYSSSACVYPEYKQTDIKVTPLKEEDAIPAEPQDAYGWEKLLTEFLCKHYTADYGFQTRVARFHNIFGSLGSWDDERTKAPAAICRKIAIAKVTGNHEIEIWGDGEQTRSFCYIRDCLEGVYKLMQSDHSEPLNIGQDRLISINELVDMAAKIAGIQITKKHIPGPQGVRGRNSDNTKLKQVLNWEPQISLEEGMRETYEWIEKQVMVKYGKGN